MDIYSCIKEIQQLSDPGEREWEMLSLAHQTGRYVAYLDKVYDTARENQQAFSLTDSLEVLDKSPKKFDWLVASWPTADGKLNQWNGELIVQIITLRSHVGEDGIMHLQVPVGKTDMDLEVVVIIQPSTPASQANSPEARGWPPGFFERTAGAWQGEPLIRGEQGEYEKRDELS